MDANGLRFWMLADAADWRFNGDLQHDGDRRSLRLASQRWREAVSPAESPVVEANALERLDRVPPTIDHFGTWAYWDEAAGVVMAAGAAEEAVPLFLPPAGQSPTDLAVGFDGVLYVAAPGQVLMKDLRGRFPVTAVELVDFDPWRLAADPAGGVWVLDRSGALARLQGRPLPRRPYAPYSADVARPCPENPDPPRLSLIEEAEWPEGERPAAISCSLTGKLAVLAWDTDGQGLLRFLNEEWSWSQAAVLEGAVYPYTLAWESDEQLAVMVPALTDEALVFPTSPGDQSIKAIGDFYPLQRHDGGPFLNGLTYPPHYCAETEPAPLHHLSLPSYARTGEAMNARVFDSQNTQTVWHRLYLEAAIPAHCGIKIYLATTDDGDSESLMDEGVWDEDQWHEHRFGLRFTQNNDRYVPCGAWIDAPSEIPFHPGLSNCRPEPDRIGLFTCLIQRPRRKVRDLRGRFLHIRTELSGDGRTTPEVWALRAYGSRFSYVDHYLPLIYHEQLFGADADALLANGQQSSPADFLERFLNNFEGVLTPLEDQVASSYLLTDPRTTPTEALPWLGSWIGVSFDPAYPAARRRRLLAHSPELYRKRGTLSGLALALDLATGGAVTAGQIVILEDWRLRRTFATILGADLADEDDPLLSGIAVSGNSYVGDTLFLGERNEAGEEVSKEFLALFRPDIAEEGPESKAVQALFDNLAYRVTIMVQEGTTAQDMGLIRRVTAMETPAHIEAKVLPVSRSLLVGMASLVGVDTYLSEERPPEPVRVGKSHVGVRDVIRQLPSLDPRLESGRSRWSRPVARIDAPGEVTFSETFTLDGSNSQAEAGKRLTRYLWTLTSVTPEAAGGEAPDEGG